MTVIMVRTWESTSDLIHSILLFFSIYGYLCLNHKMFDVLLYCQLYPICPLLLFPAISSEIKLEVAPVGEPRRLPPRPWISLTTRFIAFCFTLEYMHIKVTCTVKQVSVTGKAKGLWNKQIVFTVQSLRLPRTYFR